MTIDYFNELLKKPSIFKDESKLDINYVPKFLPHREKELSLLSQLFLILITNPNSISRKILVSGKTGIGKTATVKFFAEMFERKTKSLNINTRYIHINCRKERTSYKVLIKIIRSLNKNFPKRGYSPQDLLEIIVDLLNEQDLHLLIVLDELSYLINKTGDLIYSLTRVYDDALNAPQRLSIIGIVRDISCLNNLDVSTLSTLQRNIVKFDNYSMEQIIDILKYRAEISLKEDVLNEKLIKMAAQIVFKIGDIRYGLNLIWKASKIAESQNLKYITADCIRRGNQGLFPFSTQDILKYLNSQKLIFLLAIVKALKKSEAPQISILDLLNSYQILCESAELIPRSYSQLWNYIQEYKRENIITLNVKSENIKGRKSLISIPDMHLLQFEKLILDFLNSKEIKI